MFFVSEHSVYFILYNFFGLALSWFLALQSQNQIRSTVKSTVELQNCSNHVLKTGIDTAEDARSSSALSIPAMHAVRKRVALPAMKARKATSVIVLLFSGAIVTSAPIKMPIDEGFEKPHSAYVAISSDLGF